MGRLAATASNHSSQPSLPRRDKFLREMRRFSLSKSSLSATAKNGSDESLKMVDE